MHEIGQSVATQSRNWLLRALPPVEQELVSQHLERLHLDVGHVVSEFGVPIPYIYFPEDAVISSLSVMADGSAVETATIGPEAISGLAVFHGVEGTCEHVFVQVPGDAYRMPAAAFREVVKQAPELAAALHRLSVALFTLAGQNSGCNRKHSVLKRCARWLLMCHDRVGRDQFELTHHVLSQMLGVRRASVTEAALALNDVGAIEYRRGVVRILDRAALERSACECYWIIRSTFDHLLGDGRTPNPLAGVKLSKGGRSIAKDGTPQDAVGDETTP